jgi:hypothetical protein
MRKSKRKPAAEKLSPFARTAIRAMHKARREAEKENARWGLPMIVWQNGRIVELPARK